MTGKPIRQRPTAIDDHDGVVDYYLEQSGNRLATRFSTALKDAFERISRNPGIGSRLVGDHCGLPGLRTWPIPNFPYLVCYFDTSNDIDVLRILHGARDLDAVFADPPEDGDQA